MKPSAMKRSATPSGHTSVELQPTKPFWTRLKITEQYTVQNAQNLNSTLKTANGRDS